MTGMFNHGFNGVPQSNWWNCNGASNYNCIPHAQKDGQQYLGGGFSNIVSGLGGGTTWPFASRDTNFGDWNGYSNTGNTVNTAGNGNNGDIIGSWLAGLGANNRQNTPINVWV